MAPRILPVTPLTSPEPPEGGPEPRKRPRQARSRITVDAILEAAAQVLVGGGYDALTTAAVAERAGVSIGTLYQYYPDKAALGAGLLEAHLAWEVGQMNAAIEAAADLPLGEGIDCVVRAFVEANAGEPERSAALLAIAAAVGWTDGIAALASQTVDAVASLLAGRAEASRVADLRLAAFVAVSAVDGLVQRAVALRPEAVASGVMAEEACDLARRYLVAEDHEVAEGTGTDTTTSRSRRDRSQT